MARVHTGYDTPELLQTFQEHDHETSNARVVSKEARNKAAEVAVTSQMSPREIVSTILATMDEHANADFDEENICRMIRDQWQRHFHYQILNPCLTSFF